MTFNKIVKIELDKCFEKVNSHYAKTNQGISLSTIDGHYWLEIHIDQNKTIDEFEMASPAFQNKIKKNIDYVISLAKVSRRG